MQMTNTTPAKPCPRTGEEEGKALREAVHSVCQIVNSLGKAIEYLKDDVEAMINEQQFWTKDERLQQDQLEEEKRITEEMLQDEAGQLTDLEERLDYQQRQIFSLKGEIVQNDELIMKFLRLVTTPVDVVVMKAQSKAQVE